jgi:tRNA threonylcarbamoyladenosine biosynthesis protein TsaE
VSERTEPTIRIVGPESAGVVVSVVRQAFADRPPLDPPTDALGETEETAAERLARGCGLLAEVDGEVMGAVVLDPSPHGDAVFLRRFGLTPAARGRGVANALVRAALRTASGLGDGVARRAVVVAREELPHTVRFWTQQGFSEIVHRSPYMELARALPRRLVIPTADDMRDLATRLAGVLRAGDVVVLSGDLGAGKTTFTQGLGAALGVRGQITSPTFVIARVHPSLTDGPDLIHVDAYRLGGPAELDDLDLDTDVDRAVTVVEWGEGLAEDLADSPLEIRITRAVGGEVADDTDRRAVEIDPLGPRWLDVDLPV